MAGGWARLTCLAVPAVVLLVSFPLGVRWLEPGDFAWREAMTYHGVLVPAWMLLASLYVGSLYRSSRRVAVEER